MAKIYPFSGLCYARNRVPLEKVAIQPYDHISKDTRDYYYDLHPNNIIRVILGNSTPEDLTANVYAGSADYLKQWRANGIIEPLPGPAFFIYFQRFQTPDARDYHVRKGFVGLGRLEHYSNRVIFPHERTLTRSKEARLELLRQTRTHLDQIFMLYEDPTRHIDSVLDYAAQGKPDIEVEDEYGVLHRMWVVMDEKIIAILQSSMEDRKLIIADGHHRYEAALALRDQMNGDAPYDRIPMTFFNMDSPSLTILPTHRVVSNLPHFHPSKLFQRAAEFFHICERPSVRHEGCTIVTCTDGGHLSYWLLKSSFNLTSFMPGLSEKERNLDVNVLHRLVIEQCLGIIQEELNKESCLSYVREKENAISAVRSGGAQAAFLMNPTRIDQVRDVAYEGNVMPQKSTDFYPKLLTGLLMFAFEDSAIPGQGLCGRNRREHFAVATDV